MIAFRSIAWRRWRSIAAVVAFFLMSAPRATLRADPPSDSRQQQWENELKLGLTPLLVLGDLNEDGRVDQKDRRLLAQMVASHGQRIPAEVTCAAAADINSDRRVDKSDLDEMDRWFAHGQVVEAPALVHRVTPGCSMSHVFIAAQLTSVNREPVSIQFLDHQLNSRNSNVAVLYGAATVKPETDGTGFVVTPATSQEGGTITVAINLPGKRKYLYTFPIAVSSRTR